MEEMYKMRVKRYFVSLCLTLIFCAFSYFIADIYFKATEATKQDISAFVNISEPVKVKVDTKIMDNIAAAGSALMPARLHAAVKFIEGMVKIF